MKLLGFLLIGLGLFVKYHSLRRLLRDAERTKDYLSTWELMKKRGLWRPERLLAAVLFVSGILLLLIAYSS
jgi:hypothetical protein